MSECKSMQQEMTVPAEIHAVSMTSCEIEREMWDRHKDKKEILSP